MKHIFIYIWVCLFLLFQISCISIPSKPKLNPSADSETRMKQYKDYQLNMNGDFFFGYKITRKNDPGKEYSFSSIDELMKDSSNVALSEHQMGKVYTYISIPLAIGSGYLAGNLVAPDPDLIIANQRNRQISVAGGLFAVSLVFAYISQTYYKSSVQLYNQNLKSQLNIATLTSDPEPFINEPLRFYLVLSMIKF